MEGKAKKHIHEQVRDWMLEIQEFGGAAIKPLALYQIFYEILERDQKSKMNRSKVRDLVDTYCALCNEFFIIYHYDKKPSHEFYMSQKRWDKYYLGQKARESSIRILKFYEFIHCRNTKNPYKPVNTVRMYSIDLKMLKLLKELAEERFEKSKAKK